MPSKAKEARLDQKAYWENKLNQRLTLLGEKGLDSKKISKDGTVRSLRAKIRKTDSRLRAIHTLEKKADDMTKAKAEKTAVPKVEKGKKGKKKDEASTASKRQQKKQKKREGKSQAKE